MATPTPNKYFWVSVTCRFTPNWPSLYNCPFASYVPNRILSMYEHSTSSDSSLEEEEEDEEEEEEEEEKGIVDSILLVHRALSTSRRLQRL
jgi:hypothetical protein